MSYGQAYKVGDIPSAIYVVTNGRSYKVYSNISAARGLRTRNNNDNWTPEKWKIYEVDVQELKEVE